MSENMAKTVSIALKGTDKSAGRRDLHQRKWIISIVCCSLGYLLKPKRRFNPPPSHAIRLRQKHVRNWPLSDNWLLRPFDGHLLNHPQLFECPNASIIARGSIQMDFSARNNIDSWKKILGKAHLSSIIRNAEKWCMYFLRHFSTTVMCTFGIADKWATLEKYRLKDLELN